MINNNRGKEKESHSNIPTTNEEAQPREAQVVWNKRNDYVTNDTMSFSFGELKNCRTLWQWVKKLKLVTATKKAAQTLVVRIKNAVRGLGRFWRKAERTKKHCKCSWTIYNEPNAPLQFWLRCEPSSAIYYNWVRHF